MLRFLAFQWFSFFAFFLLLISKNRVEDIFCVPKIFIFCFFFVAGLVKIANENLARKKIQKWHYGFACFHVFFANKTARKKIKNLHYGFACIMGLLALKVVLKLVLEVVSAFNMLSFNDLFPKVWVLSSRLRCRAQRQFLKKIH